MFKITNSFVLIPVFLFLSTATAQSNAAHSQWTRIKDDKVGLSILFPSDFLVDNEAQKWATFEPVLASLPRIIDTVMRPTLIGNRKSVRMSLRMVRLRPVADAKYHLSHFIASDVAADRYQDFRVGDFVGRKTTFSTDKKLSASVAIAIKDRIYVIDVSALNEDSEIYRTFLTSLTLDGHALFKNDALETPETWPTKSISGLTTSKEIAAALNERRNRSDIRVTKGDLVANENTETPSYSRPYIILRQPRPEFGDISSRISFSGIVKLRVEFLANGHIGEIAILSDAPEPITKIVVEAATKIRFLPPQVDGFNVDSKRIVEYHFNIG